MIVIEVRDYMSSADCFSLTQCSIEGFPQYTGTFIGGNIYGLVSDFGCGSWALATCLGSRGDDGYEGTALLNENQINPQQLREKSCFLSENQIEGVNTPMEMGTVRSNIEKALAISGLPYSVPEIKELFHLSDGRFDRDFRYVSGEIWLISMAVGFAAGKDIFCFPWLNKIEFHRASTSIPILRFLKEQKKIILIPSSCKREIARMADHLVTMDLRKGYFQYR